MTEISDRYRRLSDDFAHKLAAVPDDRWDAPTPCPEWNVRDVARHVVDTQGMFEQLVGRDIGQIPSVDDDPCRAWATASARILADLQDPERADTGYEGHFGPTTFAESVDRFLNFDLVIHGWDLARGAGLDETISPDDLAWANEKAEGFGDAMRNPAAFGPAVDPPAGADDQSRLLAFLGRHPERVNAA
jgi:uncharacterized protein (TIGR03086 family)